MNVKIKITVPLDRVPVKISDLLQEVASDLDDLSINVNSVSKDVFEKKDYLLQLEKIDSYRKILSFLDARLEDCYDVLDGLIKYKTDKEVKNAEQPSN